jgi:hypothetical protein
MLNIHSRIANEITVVNGLSYSSCRRYQSILHFLIALLPLLKGGGHCILVLWVYAFAKIFFPPALEYLQVSPSHSPITNWWYQERAYHPKASKGAASRWRILFLPSMRFRSQFRAINDTKWSKNAPTQKTGNMSYNTADPLSSRSALRNGICECRWRYEVDLQISLGSLRQQCMFGSQPQWAWPTLELELECAMIQDAAGFDIVYLCVRGLGCLLVPDSLW